MPRTRFRAINDAFPRPFSRFLLSRIVLLLSLLFPPFLLFFSLYQASSKIASPRLLVEAVTGLSVRSCSRQSRHPPPDGSREVNIERAVSSMFEETALDRNYTL